MMFYNRVPTMCLANGVLVFKYLKFIEKDFKYFSLKTFNNKFYSYGGV